MMSCHGIFVRVLFVVSFLIVLGDGEAVSNGTEESTYNEYMAQMKRAMDPVVKGLLAWRKLLWDTKPASTHPLTTKLKSNAYFKAGDFENAIKDFTSAVPEAIMSYGGKQKGRIYKGMVGDRTVILRQRGGTFNNNFPTIEIIQGQSSDMVFYMGKNWKKGP